MAFKGGLSNARVKFEAGFENAEVEIRATGYEGELSNVDLALFAIKGTMPGVSGNAMANGDTAGPVVSYPANSNNQNFSSADTIINGANTANGIASSLVAFGGQAMVNDDLGWLGKNFKYNSLTWGGNGATGARSLAVARADALKLAGKFSFAGSLAISGYNVATGRQSPLKGALDVGMAGVGLFWPIGTFASISYFAVDYANDGNWSGN